MASGPELGPCPPPDTARCYAPPGSTSSSEGCLAQTRPPYSQYVSAFESEAMDAQTLYGVMEAQGCAPPRPASGNPTCSVPLPLALRKSWWQRGIARFHA